MASSVPFLLFFLFSFHFQTSIFAAAMADNTNANIDPRIQGHVHSVGFCLKKGTNHCYRNVGVLMMLHTAFASWFLDSKNQKDENCGRGLDEETDACVFCDFKELVQAYWFGDRKRKDHEAAMAKFWNNFKGAGSVSQFPGSGSPDDQQDVVDFLRGLLRVLNVDKHGPYMGNLEPGAKPPLEIANVGSEYLNRCVVCPYKETPDVNKAVMPCTVVVSLPDDVPGQRPTLLDCMSHTWSKMTGETCPDCKNDSLERFHYIDPLPELLLVTVEAEKFGQKETRALDFRLEGFRINSDFANLPAGQTDMAYKISAVIFHIGESMAYGHYTIGLMEMGGDWVYIDNDKGPKRYKNLERLMQASRHFVPRPDQYVVVAQQVPEPVQPSEALQPPVAAAPVPQPANEAAQQPGAGLKRPLDTSNDEGEPAEKRRKSLPGSSQDGEWEPDVDYLPVPQEGTGSGVNETAEVVQPPPVLQPQPVQTELPIRTDRVIQTDQPMTDSPIQTDQGIQTDQPMADSPTQTDQPMTDSPIQTDQGIQTDSPAQTDQETQTDQPIHTDQGIQTDPPAQTDQETQTDQPIHTDQETQTEPPAQTDQETQTDQAVQTDRPVQTDRGVQTDQQPELSTTIQEVVSIEPVLPSVGEQISAEEPSTERSSSKRPRDETEADDEPEIELEIVGQREDQDHGEEGAEEAGGKGRTTESSSTIETRRKKPKVEAVLELKVYTHEFGHIKGAAKIPMQSFIPKVTKKKGQKDVEKLRVKADVRTVDEEENGR